MKRPALIWLSFLLFLALALGAIGWMTRTVLRLDQAQAKSAAAAQLEENVRLALWRMDYAMAPILSQETARPYFEYSPVFPAERAYTRMYTELKSGDVLVPSPLIKSPSPYILLYFQIDPTGNVTSPQAPTANVRRIAEARYTTAADIARAEELVKRVADLVKDPKVLTSLPAPRDPEIWQGNRIRVVANGSLANGGQSLNVRENPQRDNANNYNQAPNAPAAQYDVQQQALIQQRRGQQEYAARQQTQENNDFLFGGNTSNYAGPGVSFSVMQPLWAGDQLLLARRVAINGQSYVQGCLLDWPAVRKWLLDSVTDLPLAADLVPVHSATEESQPRRLASIPARLVIKVDAAAPDPSYFLHPSTFLATPNGVTLGVAWVGVLVACAAVALLLRGVIALSQRRAGFVSAVTHELRTPLTTLRMYTEMLADGMVADPDKQTAYHKTLRSEANRLGHLVDNVLLYSRLERSTRDTRIETAAVGELLERLTHRLSDRAAQAGMILTVTTAPAARGSAVRANLLSVEQILFNLVDNACKYAGGATADRTIAVTVDRTDRHVEIRVADHGPGLDASARARLFQPFSKSVNEAANSAPGLGLGLALSRRLARTMNADLCLERSDTSGTVFALTLPLA